MRYWIRQISQLDQPRSFRRVAASFSQVAPANSRRLIRFQALCMRTFIMFLSVAVLVMFFQGCSTPQRAAEPEKTYSQADIRVNFTDPVLSSRQILLFGSINQQTAEIAIQKLLFLDSRGNEPIDLFLETPGGDLKYAWAIYQIMRLIHSPVNTYALSECNSGGVMLLAAGTGKRRAFRGAVIVIHGIKPGVGDHKPPPEFVADLQNSYTEFWHKYTKLPQSWLPLPLDSSHILTAEQALDCGIVDEIVNK